VISAIFIIAALGAVMGTLLGVASRYLAVEDNPLAAEIAELFPGSQCGQCGYPGCGPAAAAVAKGEAPLTLCSPGGRALVEALAEKMGVSVNLAEGGVHTREPLRWLHQVLQTLFHRRDSGWPKTDPCGLRRRLHGLWEVLRRLPHRMHRDAPGETDLADLVLARAGKGGLTIRVDQTW
jgi:hypothetical protein